jgi:threonine dehydratase
VTRSSLNNIVTYDDIKKARIVLEGKIKKTPLDRSSTFSKITSSELYLKMENMQKTGSFKSRGAFVKLSYLNEEERRRGVVAASAGNHAQGVAYSASILGIKAKIVMPETASPAKIDATKSYGAEIILKGRIFDDSLNEALSICKRDGSVFVHAYDDINVISGQGTVGLEIVEELPDVDAIVVPVGGGGLISGIAVAAKSFNRKVKVYGVQSEAFPSAYMLLKKGYVKPVENGDTIADGIAVKKPGEITSRIMRDYVDDIFLVSDREIAEAMFLLLERAKVVSEPAGASSLAALLSGKIDVRGMKVVSVISGGNVDMYTLDQIVSRGLERYGRLIRLKFILKDSPGSLRQIIDVVSGMGANILDVQHQRLGSEVPLGRAAVVLSLETQNTEHTKHLLEGLKQKGLSFTVLY